MTRLHEIDPPGHRPGQSALSSAITTTLNSGLRKNTREWTPHLPPRTVYRFPCVPVHYNSSVHTSLGADRHRMTFARDSALGSLVFVIVTGGKYE